MNTVCFISYFSSHSNLEMIFASHHFIDKIDLLAYSIPSVVPDRQTFNADINGHFDPHIRNVTMGWC